MQLLETRNHVVERLFLPKGRVVLNGAGQRGNLPFLNHGRHTLFVKEPCLDLFDHQVEVGDHTLDISKIVLRGDAGKIHSMASEAQVHSLTHPNSSSLR